ncbi:ComF family protein [Teredinibacter haidensis]|uniref:ComF family protein n=1 Tax=Teredinibacter haidensis TaxID=2731755 RepID=UPI0009F8592D|nr:ComF family protein [Teredinibacter haidensis]
MDQTLTYNKIINKALDLLLPNHCYLCDQTCSQTLCAQCRADLPLSQSDHCHICALPLPSQGICGECQKRKPSFDKCVTAYAYSGHIPTLINDFKHREQHAVGRQLTTQLAVQLSQIQDIPDALLAVPLHWKNQLKRGFNQADVIARELGKRLQIPVKYLVTKQQASHHQQQLTRRQRLANNLQAFRCESQLAIRHIALIDDVVTTGATAEIISRLLKKEGVTKVTLCALARTPKIH